MLMDCMKKLSNPNKKFRGIPFWSWNDKLENTELRWQVKEQDKAGLGGYFMHARGGLKTEYLGKEWLESIETCIDEGKIHAMGSWLYDENGWPSGFAGGRIPKKGLKYQQKYLVFEITTRENIRASGATVGIYETWGKFSRIRNIENFERDSEMLHVYYKTNPYYVDLLDHNVVNEFIDSTHEFYYGQFKEYFGNAIPGIFTDEPQYGREAVPWSFIIPDAFKERYGYDIIDVLSAIYYKIPGYESVRYDFWNLLTNLFVEGYAKQIGMWCEAHNCKLTGHILLEEDMRYQTMCSGSAMGFYQYMHLPGIDWLGRRVGNPVIGKQVSSVANQLGKKQVISEMFAASGWSVSFEEMKWIAEWQYALGVNLMCAHLEGYSIRGLRKRDYPPGMFFQSPWWKEYSKFNDYFARLGMFLSEGENEADVLVIHPLRSGWIAFDESCYHSQVNQDIRYLDDQFAVLSNILSSLHFNYHYGDEDIIAKYGSVNMGDFVIGQCKYRTVVIPPSTTLDSVTITLLNQFVAQGGIVFRFNMFPSMCQGRYTQELQTVKDRAVMLEMDKYIIEKRLRKAASRPVCIKSTEGEIEKILHQIRKYQDGNGVFMVNTDKEKGYDALIEIDWDKDLFILDLENGKVKKCLYEVNNRKKRLNLYFAPTQSYMIMAVNDGVIKQGDIIEKNYEAITDKKYVRNCFPLKDQWNIEAEDLNAFTMDYCQLKIGDGKWSDIKPVITVQKEVIQLGRNTDITLKFQFTSMFTFEQDRELYLVIEDADNYDIYVNDIFVENKSCEWWRDKSFKKVNIQGLVKSGNNTIILKRFFHNSLEILKKLERAKKFEAEANMLTFDSEIESIYLLGDFFVESDQKYITIENNGLLQKGSFCLAKCRKREYLSEFTCSGYPFFSGSIKLCQEINIYNLNEYKQLIFKMEKPYAAVTKLYVNDIEVKTLMWTPYEVDIYSYVKEGINKISLELLSTNRNLLGPHHHPAGELHSVGPINFTPDTGWTDDYCFTKFGLTEAPVLYAYSK